MTRVQLISPVGAPAATTPEADGSGGYSWVAAATAGALAKLPIRTAVTTSGSAVADAHNQVDATSGALSIALPAGQILGTLVNVEKIDSSANAVTVTGSIRGVGSSSLPLRLSHESVLFEADASGSWWPIAGHKTLGSLDARYVTTSNGAGSSVWIGVSAGGPHRVALTESNSVAVGYQALGAEDTTGGNNVAVGQKAMGLTTDGNANVAVGSAALWQNVHGNFCTAIGDAALQNNTVDQNTAIGENAGVNNTTGTQNVFIGRNAGGDAAITGSGNSTAWIAGGSIGQSTGNHLVGVGVGTFNAGFTTGSDNVAIGYLSMGQGQVSGGNNIAMGTASLEALSSGTQNVALGSSALIALTTGGSNVAVGFKALFVATTQSNLTAVGNGALQNSTGTSLTAVGSGAGAGITTGTQSVAIGTNSLNAGVGVVGTVAIGYQAMLSGTGSSNVAIGNNALKVNTGGNSTAVGNGALIAATTGLDNTAVGINGLAAVVTTNFSTSLGYNAGNTDGTTATTDNASMTLIGERAQATTANVIVLGKATATRPNMVFGAVGASALFGSGVGVMAWAPAVTNPSGNPTGATLTYVDSATNQFTARDPNGVISRMSQLANGTATLVAGTVTVANANITANSIVKAWNVKAAGTVGALSVTLTAATNFIINSTSGTDTSKVYYEIVSY